MGLGGRESEVLGPAVAQWLLGRGVVFERAAVGGPRDGRCCCTAPSMMERGDQRYNAISNSAATNEREGTGSASTPGSVDNICGGLNAQLQLAHVPYSWRRST